MGARVGSETQERRVAIYRAGLLPLSETFIRDQAAALATWKPVLLGRSEVANGLPTPGIPRDIVPKTRGRVDSAVRQWLALPEAALVRSLRTHRPQLVHAHFGVDATQVWPSAKAAGLPMVVTLHGYDINIHRSWWEAGHGGLLMRSYPRRLMQMARDPDVHFIAVSQAIARRAIDVGIAAEKVTIAPIGVDTRRFTPTGVGLEQRRKRVLYVGRMVEKKAPLLMVRIFDAVRKAVPDAELVMIGDGPLLPEAKRLAGELGVPASFLGARSPEEVLAQMHEARVFCLPSLTAENGDAEGFGLVLLEAQACGVPVVTSARGGAQEGLLDGVTGVACAEGALTEFVHGLRKLLCDDTSAKRAWLEAPRFVRSTYSLGECSMKLEQLYTRLLS